MRAVSKRLGDIATVFNGKTPSKAEQRDAGFPVLKIKDVSKTGQFRGTFASYVDESLANKHSARWVHSGDTLILNAAHNADYVASKMFLAGDDVAGTLPTGEWLLVRPHTSEAMPEYVHYWLRSAGAKNAVRFLVKGIHLYPKDVAELNIPWFPIAEQRRIVDILSRAEGIVRLRRDAEKKAAELIPALFLDMFGDPATNPKGWPVAMLPDVLACPFKNGLYLPKEQYATEGSSDGVEMVHMSDAFYGEVKRGGLRRVLAEEKQIRDYRLTKNDLLVARRSLTYDGAAKLCGIPASDEPLLFESSFIRLIPDSGKVRTEYLLYYLNDENTRRAHVLSRISGITISGINQAALNQIPVMIPLLNTQGSFVERVNDVRSIQSQQSAATAKAQATFDSLLARAFTNGD